MCVAYDGTDYSGWQFQQGAHTIEGELNRAILELTGEEVAVIGASRTDAGVHSISSMCVFDTESTVPPERFSFALNTKLPDDIRIVWSREVALDFHPRHTLTEKTYEYHIWNAPFMPPQKRLYCHWENRPLDIELMQQAADYLVGEHDFKSFCSTQTQAETTVRNVCAVKVERRDAEVIIHVTGNGFLYNMVRIIAGTLIKVGIKATSPDEVKKILDGCDRTLAGPTAPANGLMLADFKFLEVDL